MRITIEHREGDGLSFLETPAALVRTSPGGSDGDTSTTGGSLLQSNRIAFPTELCRPMRLDIEIIRSVGPNMIAHFLRRDSIARGRASHYDLGGSRASGTAFTSAGGDPASFTWSTSVIP